jgi:hypothetical protein
MRRILIFGATSAIAQATARRFASRGDAFYLIARDHARLEAVADDLRVRGAATVGTASLDALDYTEHAAALNKAIEQLGGLDIALLAHGSLPMQEQAQQSAEATLKEFEINALSTISLLTTLGNHFERAGTGTIAVISSVAGDRGRQSNYIYGSAKGAVTIFLQGLRHRLSRKGVRVITIKPGFVDTPMTASFEKKGLLWATPEQVAKDIEKAIDRQRDVVYTPWFWRYILLIVRALPEWLFKKTSM